MLFVVGVWTFLRAWLFGSAAIALENLALRHQLRVLQRSVRRPRLARRDRVLFSEAACHEQRSLVVSARPLSPPRLGGRRTAVCRARCARFVILLFALSVANHDSPAHDGTGRVEAWAATLTRQLGLARLVGRPRNCS